jgi:hypothetical protein
MGFRAVSAKSAVALALLAISASIQATGAHGQGPGRATEARAVAPPKVVTDVSRPLGIFPSSASLDSVHFTDPMLIIGTDTNATGQSYVFVVNPADLAIVDTVISLRSKVTVVTAGHVDADSTLDYLVGVDSSVTLVTGAPGATPATYHMEVTYPLRPYDSLSPTATTTGTIRDLAIDDRSGAFSVAYHTDVSYYPWPMEEERASQGGLRYYESPTADGVDLISSAAVLDLAVASDSIAVQPALFAFWYSIYENETHFVENEPRYRYFGYREFSDSQTSVTLAGVSRPGGAVTLSARAPDRIVDFTGTGLPGFIYSYASSSWKPPDLVVTYKQETAAWIVATKSKLWTLQLYGTPRVWELDGDHLPDVLLFGGSQTVGIKGNTGDELFSVNRSDIPYPVVAGTLLKEGTQHGVAFQGDTLKIFHLALDATNVQSPVLPEDYSLFNAPNPFNTLTDILYTLSSAATTRLQIYDVLGKRVRLLKQADEPAGQYRVTWNGTDERGQSVGSGVYFYQLFVNEHAVGRKMLLLK